MNRCTPSFRRARPALGTLIELSVSATSNASIDTANAAFGFMDEAFREVSRLEKILSRFDPESELFRLNERDSDEWILVSTELSQVLTLGMAVEHESNAGFRLMPECSHQSGTCYELSNGRVKRKSSSCVFDLGGIAKGFIVDQVFELLRVATFGARILVNAGGDLRCSHEERVELRVPGESEDGRYSLMIDNAAIATSSLQGGLCSVGRASARYSAKNSKESKRESARVLSASVVAKNCAAADAFAKVALLGDVERVSRSNFEIQNIYLFDRQGRGLT